MEVLVCLEGQSLVSCWVFCSIEHWTHMDDIWYLGLSKNILLCEKLTKKEENVKLFIQSLCGNLFQLVLLNIDCILVNKNELVAEFLIIFWFDQFDAGGIVLHLSWSTPCSESPPVPSWLSHSIISINQSVTMEIE